MADMNVNNLDGFKARYAELRKENYAVKAGQVGDQTFLMKNFSMTKTGKKVYVMSLHRQGKKDSAAHLRSQNRGVVNALKNVAKRDVGPRGPVLVKKYLDNIGHQSGKMLTAAQVTGAVDFVKSEIAKDKAPPKRVIKPVSRDIARPGPKKVAKKAPKDVEQPPPKKVAKPKPKNVEQPPPKKVAKKTPEDVEQQQPKLKTKSKKKSKKSSGPSRLKVALQNLRSKMKTGQALLRDVNKKAMDELGPLGPVLVNEYMEKAGHPTGKGASRKVIGQALQHARDNVLVGKLENDLLEGGVKGKSRSELFKNATLFDVMKSESGAKLFEAYALKHGRQKAIYAFTAGNELAKILDGKGTLSEKQSAFRAFVNTYARRDGGGLTPKLPGKILNGMRKAVVGGLKSDTMKKALTGFRDGVGKLMSKMKKGFTDAVSKNEVKVPDLSSVRKRLGYVAMDKQSIEAVNKPNVKDRNIQVEDDLDLDEDLDDVDLDELEAQIDVDDLDADELGIDDAEFQKDMRLADDAIRRGDELLEKFGIVMDELFDDIDDDELEEELQRILNEDD